MTALPPGIGPRQGILALGAGFLGAAAFWPVSLWPLMAVAALLVHSGATVLVAPTMDAMPWGRIKHEHHALLFQLRAVENDRWLLRACSSGRSKTISPRTVRRVLHAVIYSRTAPACGRRHGGTRSSWSDLPAPFAGELDARVSPGWTAE
jgi:hypothetical protein